MSDTEANDGMNDTLNDSVEDAELEAIKVCQTDKISKSEWIKKTT